MKRLSIPTSIRKVVLKNSGYCCNFCSSYDNLEIDHINPVSLGGTNDILNLQVLCSSCNSKKSANSIGYSEHQKNFRQNSSIPPNGMPLDVWEECMLIGEGELGLVFDGSAIRETVLSKTIELLEFNHGVTFVKNGNDAIEVGIAKAKESL